MLPKILTHMLILLFPMLFTFCNETPKISTVTQADEVRIREIGKRVTDLLLKTLQKELKTTIGDKGLAAALSVCANTASNLTDSVAKSIDGIIEIKRSSLRYRNPENAPDIHERKALTYFQSTLLKNGNLPDEMIEKINEDRNTHFRYYKPLMTKPLCLNCHGKPENVASEISYIIKQRYPQDHATGYSNEQFRGLVRISIR